MSTLAVSGRRFSWRWLMYVVLVAGVVAFLVPVYMVLVTALKQPIDINLETTWSLPKVWNWASFHERDHFGHFGFGFGRLDATD